MTITEIRAQVEITPTQLKQLGKRVLLFSTETELQKGENWNIALRRVQDKVTVALCRNKGAEVYTGHHKENDMSRVFFWQKGWHYVNRTGDFAVVLAAKGG